MRHIKTIDDITKDGKVEFGEGYDFVPDADGADAILMRSTNLHGYDLPESVRAIARCGAGVNNIPVKEYAKRGVVVFNSPGANSNAVKELVLAMLILSSRGVVQSMDWVRAHADDENILVDAESTRGCSHARSSAWARSRTSAATATTSPSTSPARPTPSR